MYMIQGGAAPLSMGWVPGPGVPTRHMGRVSGPRPPLPPMGGVGIAHPPPVVFVQKAIHVQ